MEQTMMLLPAMIVLGSTPAGTLDSLVDVAVRADAVVVAKVVGVDLGKCSTTVEAVETLRGPLPTEQIEVHECGRRRSGYKRPDSIEPYRVGEKDLVFVFKKNGELVGFSYRYNYWNDRLPWSFDIRLQHAQRILAALQEIEGGPSDGAEVLAMLGSEDETLVRVGIVFVRRDLATERRLPHREIAQMLLRQSSKERWQDGSDVQSDVAGAMIAYGKERALLDDAARAALEDAGDTLRRKNSAGRGAWQRAAAGGQ